MQGYVNINEASRLTGKHKDTIRRLVKNNKGGNNIVTGRKKEYLINKEWLFNFYDLTPENMTHTEAPQQAKQAKDEVEPTPEPTGETSNLYKTLAKQLEAKDQQIAELQKLLHEKEANNTKINDQFQQLMGRFIMLPANTPAETTATDTEPTKPKTEVKEVKPVATPKKQKPKTQQVNKKKPTPKKAKPQVKAKTDPKPTKKQRWWKR